MACNGTLQQTLCHGIGFFYAKGGSKMPDWAASFTIPKYTSEEFRKLKADYIAKYGYTITFPGLFDIIKIPIEKKMTEQEEYDWSRRFYDRFSESRLYEIREMKRKRKERFLALLGSPAPEVISNVGSFMTAIDNAQDAVFTLGAMGYLAMRFSPPPVASALAIPTGAAMTAAGALDIIQSLGKKGLPGIAAKRAWQKKTGIDPWSKKGRIKYAKYLMKTFPKKAIGIQALQTTNEIFGVGLSLGPIVGFFVDAVSGPVRRLYGDKVSVKWPIPTYDRFCRSAQHNARTVFAYFHPGVQTSDEEVITMMMATWLSNAAMFSWCKDWPAVEAVNNWDEIELGMPKPTNILTQEVIKEEGINIDDVCGWPHNNKPWALATDLVNEYDAPCKAYFDEYMGMHDKDWIGYIFKTLACDSTFYTLGTIEGEESVEVDYTAVSKTCSILLEYRMYIDMEQPKDKIQLFTSKMDGWEITGIKPTLKEITRFCRDNKISIINF